MKTTCSLNVYGLDPATWEAFRAQLRINNQSISNWLTAAILAHLRDRGALRPATPDETAFPTAEVKY